MRKLINVEAKKQKYAEALQRLREKAAMENRERAMSAQEKRIKAEDHRRQQQRRIAERTVKAAYYGMLARCYSLENPNYYRYGGRGITVCEEWRQPNGAGFQAFFSHVGNRPSQQHSLDRIDNNGNYEPDNVRWATFKEQSYNKRSNRWIEFRGEIKALTEWAEYLDISVSALSARLKK